MTWGLSPASGCGALSASGTTATYTPPSESSLNADCSASITATSAADSSKTATTTFTVKAVAITLPTGESTAPTTAAGEATVPLSATITNDATGSATLNWSISGSAVQHSSLAQPVLRNVSAKLSPVIRDQVNSSCGSLSASTGTSVTYTPPSSGSCTATITASTGVNPNVFTTFSITVNAPLSITTSALNAGTYGANYSATQLAAAGGVGSYTWTWAAANGSSLPQGLTLTSAGVLSGTPTAAGTYNVVVTATDTNSYAVQQPFSLSIGKASPTLVAGPSSISYGATGTTTASGDGSTGALSFSSGSSTGCSVSGTTVSVSNAGGTCILTAMQAADNNYNAATSAPFTVALNKASSSAGVASNLNPSTYNTSVTFTATVTGGRTGKPLPSMTAARPSAPGRLIAERPRSIPRR